MVSPEPQKIPGETVLAHLTDGKLKHILIDLVESISDNAVVLENLIMFWPKSVCARGAKTMDANAANAAG